MQNIYQIYAQLNTWNSILPEILLALLALSFLVIEITLPKEKHNYIPKIAFWGQVMLLIGALAYFTFSENLIYGESFSGLIKHSMRGELMRIFFLFCSVLVTYMANFYFKHHEKLSQTEFYPILLLITAGLMLLVQSNNFIMLFVTLETVTIGFYVLVSYRRLQAQSLEAGLKYLILGAFSSAILLFGIVLLYGVCGNPNLSYSSSDPMNFSSLEIFTSANSDNILVLAGAILVLAGIAFKIGAVPFQIWIPDVYQGAPIPTTAFLAVASKAAGFIVLINLIEGPFAPLRDSLVPLLSAMAVVTILFGNLGALSQRNIKRLLGLSGIAHAGYLLIGVVASFYITWAGDAVLFYLYTYMFASFAVFIVVGLVTPNDDTNQTLDDYKNLFKENSFLGGVLVIGLGSLAGIPPLAGFIGKFLIFVAAYQAKLYGLLAIAVIGVVISIYYYFGWIMEVVYRHNKYPVDKTDDELAKPEWAYVGIAPRLILGCLASITVILGIYQGMLKYLFL